MLKCFWTLSDADADLRRKSACEIMEHLISAQKEVDGEGKDADQCPDLQYALKRLLRGMCSSRECARQGFASVLSEVLASFECIQLQHALDRLISCTEVEGSMKGHEQRDFLVGRVFGFMALYRSGRLKGLTGSDAVVTHTIVSKLLELSKRQFLRQLVFELIIGIMGDCHPDTFAELLPMLLPTLDAEVEDYSPDQLSLAIALQRKAAALDSAHGSTLGKKLPKNIQPSANQWLVCSSKDGQSLQRLVPSLRSSSSCFPKVHSVWDNIINELQTHGEGKTGEGMNTVLLEQLWSGVVEPALLKSTHERRGLLMLLLQKLLPHLSASQVPLVFTPACVRCIMNNAKDKKTYLHSQALSLLRRLGRAAQELRVPLVSVLLTNGGIHFDQITNTKTVTKLLEGMETDALQEHTFFLEQLICEPKENAMLQQGTAVTDDADDADMLQKKLDTNRILAIEALAATAKNPRIPQSSAKRVDVLAFLMVHALFESSAEDESGSKKKKKKAKKADFLFEHGHSAGFAGAGAPKPELSLAVRSATYQRFLGMASDFPSMIMALAQQAKQAEQAKPSEAKEGEESEEGEEDADQAVESKSVEVLELDQLWPWSLHQYHDQLVSAGAQPHFSMDEDMQQQRQTMLDTVASIQGVLGKKGVTTAEKQQLLAFHRILLLLGLQQFQSFDQPDLGEEAGDSIVELSRCFVEMYKDRFPEVADKQDADDESESMDHTLVLVELLLGLLTQPSSFLRKSVKELFRLISDKLSEAALQAVLQVVCDVNEDPMDAEQEDDDEEDEEEEDEEDDEEAEEEEEGGGDKEDEDDEVDHSRISRNNGDSDDDDDEDDIVLGSDETLDHLREGAADDAMAALARLRFERSGGRAKQIKEEKFKFRLRALELFEVFMTRNPSSVLPIRIGVHVQLLRAAVDLISAVTDLRKPAAQSMLARLKSVYTKSLCRSKEIPRGAAVKEIADKLHDQMRELYEILMKAPSSALLQMGSAGLLYTARVLQGTSMLRPDQVIAVYEDALDNWMQRKNSKLQPLIFTELINRHPDLAWKLAPSLLKCTAATNGEATNKGGKDKSKDKSKARSSYARCEALRLLTQLLRTHGNGEKAAVAAEVQKSLRAAFEDAIQEAAGEDGANSDLQVRGCCTHAVAHMLLHTLLHCLGFHTLN
jgi:DNA polymerase phi